MTTRIQTILAALLLSLPASADVTLEQKVSAKGLGLSGSGAGVVQIHGAKMRTDQTIGEQTLSTIIDIDAQKMILLNAKKQQAEVTELARLRQELDKITDANVKVELTPGTETKSILGYSATRHALRIVVGYAPVPDQPMDVVLSGTVWIAKDVPGQAEYAAFYKTAAEKGFIFTDPRVAQAQPAQAKGFASYYRAVANAGVPLASEIEIRIEGSGMMATLMSKIGTAEMSTDTIAITTDPIGDDKFTIPQGYKTKTAK